jgi:DHA2 family multidrug resistance protein
MNAATGLFNLVRTIFGSVGIALAATYLERATITARAVLAENLTITSPKTSIWLEKVISGLTSQGIPESVAHQKALALLERLLTQQAAVIGYNYVFMLGVFLFAACIPLVFLFRSPKGGKEIRSLME